MNPKLSAAGSQAPAANGAMRPAAALVLPPGDPGRTQPDRATIHIARPTKAPRPCSQQEVSAESILRSFNTWAFKRAQPDSPQRLLQAISVATRLGQPIPFVLYWGKGPRHTLSSHDATCLDYLLAFTDRVRSVYQEGASLRLIFTDTHADLNGHTREHTRQYFDAIAATAHERGFKWCWLSELVLAVQFIISKNQHRETVPEETLRQLGACAAKWYHGEGTPRDGAMRYYRLNMIEKEAVQVAFPMSVFVTFNGPAYRCLFPEKMPIFYMYSLRRGFSSKPWFLSAETQPSEGAP